MALTSIRTLGRNINRVTMKFFCCGVAPLFILCAQAPAQTSSDVIETHKWVRSVGQDRIVREQVLKLRTASSDPCDMQNSPEPFDPLPCVDLQKKEWLALMKRAEEVKAPVIVKTTIPRIVERLNNFENHWKSLSPAEREARRRNRKELQMVIKERQQEIKELQEVANDPNRSAETRTAARTF